MEFYSTIEEHLLGAKISKIAPIFIVMAIFWIYPTADIADTRYSAYFRFVAASVVLFALMMWGINRWVALFFMVAALSSIFPFSTRESSFAMRAVFIGCLWFYLISRMPKYSVPWLMNAMCVVAIFNSVMVLSQFFGFDPIFIPKKDFAGTVPIVGFTGNPNEAAALLAFCIPAFFRKRWSWVLLLIIPGVIVTNTSAGIACVAIAIATYALLKGGWIEYLLCFYALIMAICYIIAFDGSIVPNSLKERFLAWETGYEIYKSHYLFGYGLGHWKEIFKHLSVANQFWPQAHNEFVQGLFEIGISFVVCIIGYVINIAKKCFKNKKDMIIPISAMAAIIANSCVNFPFHIAQTALMAITWMGIIEIINRNEETNS